MLRCLSLIGGTQRRIFFQLFFFCNDETQRQCEGNGFDIHPEEFIISISHPQPVVFTVCATPGLNIFLYFLIYNSHIYFFYKTQLFWNRRHFYLFRTVILIYCNYYTLNDHFQKVLIVVFNNKTCDNGV